MADARLKKKVGVGRHLSAIKRHRQSEKKTEANKHVKSLTKTEVKKVRSAIDEGKKDIAASQLNKTISTLAKAATKGVIPTQRASRLSSRLTKAINKMS